MIVRAFFALSLIATTAPSTAFAGQSSQGCFMQGQAVDPCYCSGTCGGGGGGSAPSGNNTDAQIMNTFNNTMNFLNQAGQAIDESNRASAAKRAQEEAVKKQKEEQEHQELGSEMLMGIDSVKQNPPPPPAKAPAPKNVDCGKYSNQLARDQEAIRRLEKSNRTGNEELKEWADKSEEAQKDAFKQGRDLLIASAEAAVEEQEKLVANYETAYEESAKHAAAGDKSWLTLKQVRLAKQKIKENKARLENMKNAAESAKNARDQFDDFEKEKEKAEAEDKETRSLLQKIKAAAKKQFDEKKNYIKGESDEETADQAQELAKKGLSKVFGSAPTEFGAFVVNYGYDAAKWGSAAMAIKQNGQLKDQQLKAFNSLQKQMECTVRKLQACRAGQPVVSCHEGRAVSSQ